MSSTESDADHQHRVAFTPKSPAQATKTKKEAGYAASFLMYDPKGLP
ncbi:hypothetical protein PhaeoP57_00854 [Phaeobacter inhibens]|nr:hypothetical protein PhaeoP51_00822 [Phaeobacter inhibens]AUQ81807.1 hypothetical protein PhaeoP57_00854 [Phaeobacter inhibens]AUQ89530.1 hypothetical protein PhaeoP24_00889 [Phaeobacter inhibens]